ncbi:hypothetical protein BH09VER1_BH09VER1_34150 [soil metagenome]
MRLPFLLPLLAATSLWADDFKAPPGGTPILGAKPLEAFHGDTKEMQAELKDGAWKITTTGPFAAEYMAQLIARTTTPVKKGDVLFATVTLRGTAQTETEAAEVTFLFQKATEPWDKSLALPIDLTSEWKTYTAAFVSEADYAPGQACVIFFLGYPKQTVEISQVEVLNYGTKVARQDLPASKVTYAGREPDATWRKAAEERIDKIRKGPLTIKIVDENGKPVPDAAVEIRQTRHAFHFGSAVIASRITGTTTDDAKYRDAFLSLFDTAVFENDLKWPDWERRDRAKVFQALDWLDAHHIPARGHCLVWPSWIFLPKNVKESAGNWLELRQRIDSHVRDEVTALKGRLIQWDVVNEPFTNHQTTDIVGRDSLPHWFQLAHECDPKPVLFLNDYAGFMNSGRDTAHKDAFEETANYLKAQGAPIGGLGIQSHFNSRVTPPDRLLTELDRWAKLDLQIAITEFDIDTTDDSLQADYTRDFLTAVFSHPSVNGLLTWGFWEGAHWKPEAALLAKDWSDKPAGKVWRELVRGKWWTKEDLKTDAQGQCALRGFKGLYTINASKGELIGSTETEITDQASTVTIHLKKKSEPTPTPTPNASPSASPSPTTSATPTPSPSPSPSATPSPTASPSPSSTAPQAQVKAGKNDKNAAK